MGEVEQSHGTDKLSAFARYGRTGRRFRFAAHAEGLKMIRIRTQKRTANKVDTI